MVGSERLCLTCNKYRPSWFRAKAYGRGFKNRSKNTRNMVWVRGEWSVVVFGFTVKDECWREA